MKVLITGIGGFLGRHLGKALIDAGHEVRGVCKSRVDIGSAEIVIGDVLDKQFMEASCKGMDCVIHLAAVTEFSNITKDPIGSMETSVSGTLNALHGLAKAGGRKFIFPSSGKVYGKPKSLPITEQHTLNPESHLGRTKKLCEELLAFHDSCTAKSYVSLRIFNVYGPGQKEYFLVPTILSQIDSGEITLGDIHSKRDYVYVKDVAEAFIKVMEAEGNGFEAYNVGSGNSSSAEDVMHRISEITHRKYTIKTDASRLRGGEASDERADISKLKALGWSPRYGLAKGLSEMMAACRP